MSDLYRSRQLPIQLLFLLAALVLLAKAAHLQVLDKSNRAKADATAIEKYSLYPSRGLIYDRNGALLVNNDPMYDLLVTYNQIDPGMDTALFCQLLDITRDDFLQALDKDWRSGRFSKRLPFVFLSKISAATYATFQEHLHKFPGFSVRLRNVRAYSHQNAAHLLGYIREVNNDEVALGGGVYAPGDYIGASGLEYAYEVELRGRKGARYVLKDNLGRDVGAYREGKDDTLAVSGHDLDISIDLELQQYAEKLMKNKVGGIVAIEPATGEVLTMVSTPTYAPNQLAIDRDRGKAYARLVNDTLNPFFDRAVMAQYPPGSLFKPLVALIAMQEGKLHPNRTISCGGAYYLNGAPLLGCHGHPTCLNVSMAIQHSCNAYFVTVYREVVDQFGFGNPQQGLDTFNAYLDRFGMGQPLGIDFPREKPGNYPTARYYDTWYQGQKRNSVWIRSLGIGQGELLMTTLQMANLAATIANRGHYFTPHLLTDYHNGNRTIPDDFKTPHSVGIDAVHFGPVIDGMEMVTLAGTARLAYIPDIPVCGKTGTAENPHGKDHSIFFAFAPKENPRIAIAVFIENAGFGGTYAAPIASLIIEKYLRNGEIHPSRAWIEQRMLQTNLIELP